MEFFKYLLDLVLHLDKHLNALGGQLGGWLYVLLFLVIFCETGLVVTPFLPGDSLLFAIGALAATPTSVLNVHLVVVLLSIAAILGDTVNYWIGKKVGPKVFRSDTSRFFDRRHLDRTARFYAKYGAKTIIIARFVPIVRTFAPFVAGIGAMHYPKFLFYNVIGGLLWIASMTYAGYAFGNIPFVKKNFSLVVLGIIMVSLLPAVIEIARERLSSREAAEAPPASTPLISPDRLP
ncbi:MAG: DedA family protein [Chloracidobacterium sp.]|uniref:DedA family protein n=1 Tax=Chloracidobacterium validum TaxID=2821543 RepID=A0ABX8B811_9BACT|nr:DedA family protein [Chloracidobacterium validum]QUW02196.1 DedA family protein [Chloracidobacterium validum]